MPVATPSHERLLAMEDRLSSDGLLEKDYDGHKPSLLSYRLLLKISWLAQGILFVTSASFFYSSVKRVPTDMQCVNHMSTYCEQFRFYIPC